MTLTLRAAAQAVLDARDELSRLKREHGDDIPLEAVAVGMDLTAAVDALREALAQPDLDTPVLEAAEAYLRSRDYGIELARSDFPVLTQRNHGETQHGLFLALDAAIRARRAGGTA